MRSDDYTSLDRDTSSSFTQDDTWRIFRIVAEFVEGFEDLSKIGPAVTIFGSARTPEDSKFYKKAEETAQLFAQAGYAVITGGGPGIMEAANKGALGTKGKVHRLEHRTSLRAEAESLHRDPVIVQILLLPQDHVREVRLGIRHISGRFGNTG